MDVPEKKAYSLERAMQTARISLKNAVNAVIRNTGLPMCILDGILCEILAEIRRYELENAVSTGEEELDEHDRHES